MSSSSALDQRVIYQEVPAALSTSLAHPATKVFYYNHVRHLVHYLWTMINGRDFGSPYDLQREFIRNHMLHFAQALEISKIHYSFNAFL